MLMTRHTRKWKENEASSLKKCFETYPVIGFINLQKSPTALLQSIRKKLSANTKIKVSKTRVIQKALAGTKLDKEKIMPLLQGSIGIVFTEMDPFELFSTIKKSKISAPVKTGMVAENDIVVPEGDTGLPPGPLLSNLKAAGIPVQIQGGSIKVTRDFIAVKKGVIITPEVTGAFATLDLKPLKLGMNLSAVYSKGELFNAQVLDIDIDAFTAKLQQAYNNAFNLSFNACYVTKENIELLLQKAFRDAKSVSVEGNFLTKATVEDILAKASRQAKALQEIMPKTEVPAQ